MDLKLNNNRHLTVSTFPDSIKAKITTVYIKDCREITENAFSFLNSIMSLQESVTPKLSRIRVDIGARAGSYSDLMKFSNLQGFDDDYNFQAKPRFVGSYYIDSWHTIEQLNNARSIFESADFTISNDSTKIINFNDLAVQTLDSTKPNYNPAVAIILQGQNKGITISNPVVSGGGRWFLTKSQATAITAISTWFKQKVSVTDTNGIVSSDSTISYNFEHFDELQYFGITGLSNAFYDCSKLESVILPSTISSLPGGNYIENAMFSNCRSLKTINLDNITSFGKHTFHGCSSLENVALNNQVSIIPVQCFRGCTKIKLNFPTSLTSIESEAFSGCSSLEGTSLPNGVTYLGQAAFAGCSKLSLSSLPTSLVTISSGKYSENGTFFNCSLVSFNEIPASVTTIKGMPFSGCSSIPYLHILSSSVIATDALNGYGIYAGNSFKYYVGDGSSAAHDDAILADYLADTTINGWASQPTRLETWYNFLHPQS